LTHSPNRPRDGGGFDQQGNSATATERDLTPPASSDAIPTKDEEEEVSQITSALTVAAAASEVILSDEADAAVADWKMSGCAESATAMEVCGSIASPPSVLPA
jgi:hypothetical protein